jgi:hypothetical protein
MGQGKEGWEWVRIQSDPCPQCGLDLAARPVGALGAAGVEAANAWGRFLVTADGAALRRHPAPGVWSPLQYGLHVRDMYRVFGDRIQVAVAEDDPRVAWFDPGEDEWRRYDTVDQRAAASAIEGQGVRLAAILDGLGPGDWDRTARRDGVDRFTVAGLACFAVHEAHHHLLDATGDLAGAPGDQGASN